MKGFRDLVGAARAPLFLRDRSGNFAVVAGLCMLPLVASIGIAIDHSRGVSALHRVQNSADAAVIAAVKNRVGSALGEADEAAADAIFLANLGARAGLEIEETALRAFSDERPDLVVYEVRYKLDTPFGSLIGIDGLRTSVAAVAGAAADPLDIVLALDSTGSMANASRMTELKAAVKLFLDQFAGNGDARIGLVPFDVQVRVDDAVFPSAAAASPPNPFAPGGDCSAIRDARDRQACEANEGSNVIPCTQAAIRDRSDRNACVALTGGKGFAENTCWFDDVMQHPDDDDDGRRHGDDDDDDDRRRHGDDDDDDDDDGRRHGADPEPVHWHTEEYCTTRSGDRLVTMRRDTIYDGRYPDASDPRAHRSHDDNHFVASQPYVEGAAAPVATKDNAAETASNDLLLDEDEPWSGCLVDRSQPHDADAAAPTPSDPATLYPRANCARDSLVAIQPLTADFARLKSVVDTLKPSGNTNITIGVQWGMEVLSSSNPMTGARPEARKIMILLTDGDNTQNRWHGRGDSALIDARTTLACGNAKAAGIEMHTIRLMEGNAALLSGCATDAAHYSSVTAASQLTATFAAIARHIRTITLVH